jgi:hypothetical protein
MRAAGYDSVSELSNLTNEFLTKQLRAHEKLGDNVEVTSFEAKPFGGGALGVTCRIELTYSGETSAPKTVVWKSANQTTSKELKSYSFAPVLDRETAVYRSLNEVLMGVMPEMYYAYSNGALAESVLILEDLQGCRGGKFNPNCPVADAKMVMQAAGKFQRESWDYEWSAAEKEYFKCPLAAIYLHQDHWKAVSEKKVLLSQICVCFFLLMDIFIRPNGPKTMLLCL